MASDDMKAIVSRFIQVWGSGGPELVDEVAAPDITVAYPLLPEELHSAEAFKQVLAQVHAGLPDLQLEADEPIAEGDRVAVRWTLQGTHRGNCSGFRQPAGVSAGRASRSTGWRAAKWWKSAAKRMRWGRYGSWA